MEIKDDKYDDELLSITTKYTIANAIVYEKNRAFRTSEKIVHFEAIRQEIWRQAEKLQEQQSASVFAL